MSVNNDNPVKNHGPSPSPFANSSIPVSTSSIPQTQSQLAPSFHGNQFQFPRAQVQAVSLQSKPPGHAQAILQPPHNQFQAQLQSQGVVQSQTQTAAVGGGTGNLGQVYSSIISPNVKRVIQKPPVRPVPPSANPPASLKPIDLNSRKKKQKLPDKQLQEVAALLPESSLYTQLLEFESRIDAAISRKKVDIQEALKIPPSVQKTLRIYVFNTYANQTHSIPRRPTTNTTTTSTFDPPSWTLRIMGRILEDTNLNSMDADQASASQQQTSPVSPSHPKFSSFFKRVTISLDQRLYPDNHMIVWEHARSSVAHEGFEVKRKGDKEFTVNIRLEMNYSPEKFKLSPALMDVLGIEVDTRPRIIAAIWHYVKARKLQTPSDPSFFHCDAPLLKVFGEEKVKFTMVSQKISPHLSSPQPIHLEHQVKLSGNTPCGHVCYDISVDAPFPIQKELSSLLANSEKKKEIEACDEAISTAIKKIHEHRRRRAFFLGFSQSPVEFINGLIESQSRDLKLISVDPGRSSEKERQSDFFSQPWVEDAVIRYLNRKASIASDRLPGSA